LITEPELQTIEQYRETSGRERRSLLLQVSELRALESRRKAESETLRRRLSQAREDQRRLEQSFNEYEAAQLTLLSSKNGEISGLKESLAGEKLKLQKARSLNLIMGGLLAMAAVLLAVYLYVKIRTGGLLKLVG
jgi:DNA repair exonuclease SbcCD ATPase subunit